MTHRFRIAAAILLVAAAASVLAVAAAAHSAAPAKLIGTVGKNDAYKITLTDARGKLVKTLKAGRYTFVIHDDSTFHNYELDGPHGKSWTFTTVPAKATKTVTLKLGPGKYKAYCSAHESQMFQHFTVS